MQLLDDMARDMLARALQHNINEAHSSPLEIAEKTVGALAYALDLAGSTVLVNLEKTRRKYGLGATKRLIILTPRRNTITIPLTTTTKVVQFNRKPIFVSYEGGSAKFLDELIREIEAAIERADAFLSAS